MNLDFEFDNNKGDLDTCISPSDILSYIYSIFHSKTYRNRYSEFLRIDFPRVPLTHKKDLFIKLCNLGTKLVLLHRGLEPEEKESNISLKGTGNNIITKIPSKNKSLPKTEDKMFKICINDYQYFDNIPLNVWEFCFGGYYVIHKWLSSRKSRKLNESDLGFFNKLISIIDETIKIKNEIDEIIENCGFW